MNKNKEQGSREMANMRSYLWEIADQITSCYKGRLYIKRTIILSKTEMIEMCNIFIKMILNVL